jgi:OPT family small oligopeptide transporter
MEEKPFSKSTGIEVEEIRIENIHERWDPNLPDKEIQERSDDDESQIKDLQDVEENSPYEEVRVAVPNYDQDLPENTVRAWVLGIILSIVGSAMNTLFSLRQPAIAVGAIVAQLLAYAIGKAWEKIIPSSGSFNVKEQTVIVVMAGVSFGTAYATDIIVAENAFYKRDFGLGFQLLLVITTQSLGYGIAGLLRQCLVYPASMIWPANLVNVTLLHAMHGKQDDPDPSIIGGNMSRYRWFGYIFLGAFLYYFIPGFLAQFMSIFAFVTWIYPKSPVVNQLFGGTSGLSLIPLTLDWTQITGFIGSPMIPPWYAIANTLIGTMTFYIVGASALHYGGAWYSSYLPISDSGIYDNTGAKYNVSRIVTSELTLDEKAYKEYSPLFISTTFAISYGLSFAAIASLVTYTWIHHRRQIVSQLRSSRHEKPDIHMKLMLKYQEVPMLWYGSLFLAMVALALITSIHWPTEFAWWALLFAIGFSTVMTLPIGIIQAVTNQQLGLNVITEFIMGYMQPGKPLALMLFKTYGYITVGHTIRSFVLPLTLPRPPKPSLSSLT